MDKLDIVNEMLVAVGDTPILTLNTEDLWPEAELAKKMVEHEKESLLNRGWWFNQFEYTLKPTSNTQEILVPASSLQIAFPDHQNQMIARGKRVYDKSTNSFKHTSEVKAAIVADVEYDELPKTFASYLKVLCVRKFQTLREGAQGANEYSQTDELEAITHLQNEHYRNIKVDFVGDSKLKLARVRYRRNA